MRPWLPSLLLLLRSALLALPSPFAMSSRLEWSTLNLGMNPARLLPWSRMYLYTAKNKSMAKLLKKTGATISLPAFSSDALRGSTGEAAEGAILDGSALDGTHTNGDAAGGDRCNDGADIGGDGVGRNRI